MNPDDVQVRRSKIEAIQIVVADLFGMSAEELKQKSARRAVTVPRQIAIYLAKHETCASLPEIGRHFGGMHHTTVMHAIAKIEERRRTDAATDLIISKLLKGLKVD
jgi:chromosomal replication initiator protein